MLAKSIQVYSSLAETELDKNGQKHTETDGNRQNAQTQKKQIKLD